MSEFKDQAPEQVVAVVTYGGMTGVNTVISVDRKLHQLPIGTSLYTYPSAEIERLRAENNRLLSAGQALEADFSSYRREVEHKEEVNLKELIRLVYVAIERLRSCGYYSLASNLESEIKNHEKS